MSMQRMGGAPDPELPNSPIAEETDEDYDVLRREIPGDNEERISLS